MRFAEENERLLMAITEASKNFMAERMLSDKDGTADRQSSEYYKLLHIWQEALEDYCHFFRDIE